MRYMTLRPLIFSLFASVGGAHADTAAPAVLENYANIAEAAYADAYEGAKDLNAAVDAFLATPSPETLATARAAWKAARVPYQQTEVFRFGNPVVDAWEGRVNAWPLDEGLIDYVEPGSGESDENDYATLNIIANRQVNIAGVEVDASQITPDLIANTLNEADGIETNVARGYHAIEFLLWGQDLNGTGPGAGSRPHTDYVRGAGCTHGNCDRRADYLDAAADLLLDDLAEMAADWGEGGAARAVVTDDPKAGLMAMLTGMGSLSYGEMAGDRMRLGLLLHDPEEEHDCFSDNTHWSLYYDAVGIENVYLGHYRRTNGALVEGPALAALVAKADPALDRQMQTQLAASVAALKAIADKAESGMAWDQMLAPGNGAGEALLMAAIDALTAQTRTIERITAVLGLDGTKAQGAGAAGAVFQ